jgi:hypothetical protein
MNKKDEIIETELFEIYFSLDKKGRDNKKFNLHEKERILESVKNTEEMISKVTSFSKTSPISSIYRVPIIFEKFSKKTFEKKHKNHYGMTIYPPIGTRWNKIEIKAKTAVILICPMDKNDIFETISHEITHAFSNSFIESDGVNFSNKIYFLEGFTEWMTQLTYKEYQTKMKK